MNTHTVEEFLPSEISDADRDAMSELSAVVYPPQVMASVRFPASAPPPPRDWPVEQVERLFLIRHGERVIATSQLIPRRIQTAQGPLDVLGLAGVKTHPDFRLHGLGRLVVRAAFDYVDNGAFSVSLFQTAVPGFYEKLGCRCVGNTFVNRFGADPNERPWWDPNTMVYPASHPWMEGQIDLLGPAW